MYMNILLTGNYLYKVAPWLTWREILYGLGHNFISDKDAVDFAFLTLSEKSSQEEMELAFLSDRELYQTVNVLQRLASDERGANTSLDSWLYLFLSWAYDHRDYFADPLGVVEELYANFDYPEDIASIVRYMPLPEGEVGGHEYLYTNWQRVISSYKQRLEEQHGRSSS